MRGSFRRAVVVLVCSAIVLGSCGNDDDPAVRGPSPTPVATPARQCPTTMTMAIDGARTDFDVGWTGIAHDVPLHDGVALTFALTCGPVGDDACGACRIDGPADGAGGVPDRRCAADTSVGCRDDADCPGDRCADFFGPPLPITTGGAPICAMNEIVQTGPGTLRRAEGGLDLPLTVRWRFYAASDLDVPCPYCADASAGEGGVCHGGARDGLPCVPHASHALFRPSSYDCPPSALGYLAVFDMPMPLTTGTSALEPNRPCGAGGGAMCYCPGQIAPNDCAESACTVAADDEGICLAGPMDGLCAREPFRGCRNDGECAAGDHCAFRRRECAGTADAARGNAAPLSRTGTASVDAPVLAATFCIGPSPAALQNQGLGLPGPGAVRLPVAICVGDGCVPPS